MTISREKLYEEVWAEPMVQVAARYKISSSFLARVCRRMGIPCPPRGYWARKQAGLTANVPALPEAQSGEEIEWVSGSRPIARSIPFPPPSARVRRMPGPVDARRTSSGRHIHLLGIEDHFKAAREMGNEYLKPSKQLMADLFVTKKTLTQAIELANLLYLDLEARGYSVGFSPIGQHYPRPPLNHCEGRKHEASPWNTWSPTRPTVVYIGTLAVGLTLFELSEEAEAQRVNGRYVRVSDIPPPRGRKRFEPNPWTIEHEFPTGRLALRVFSPYPGVTWERRWVETEPGAFAGMFEDIAKSLKKLAPTLASQVKAAQEKQRLEFEEQMAAQAVRLKEVAIWQAARKKAEAERVRIEAITNSRQDLLKIIEQWDQANRVKAFLREVDKSLDGLEAEDRALIKDRLEQARALLGEADVLRSIREWRTPEERVN